MGNKTAVSQSVCLVLVVLCLPLLAAPRPSSGSYEVTRKIAIPGQGGWDYLIVDDANRRLYVSHGTQVEVLDVDSGAIVGKIPNTPGVHGIAIAPEQGRGFVSNGQTSTVTIFDLEDAETDWRSSGRQEAGRDHLRSGDLAGVCLQRGSNSATVIDAAEAKVVGTVDLGGGPEFAVADGNGFVFNNLEDESQVVKIDSRKLTVEQRWPTAPCQSPSAWPWTG